MDEQQQVQQQRPSFLRPRNIILVVIGLVIVASVPAWFWQTNPPVVAEPAWDSPQTRELAKRACFDCHSNETNWPIYSRIAPIAYPVTIHVVEGREELNFSEWGQKQASTSAFFAKPVYADEDEDEEREQGEEGGGGEASELVEVIIEGEMPLQDYMWLHPEARLTETEKQQLIAGFQATMGQSSASR
jgi:hypothetical protein